MKVDKFSYTCVCCGKEYTGSPSFGYDIPSFVHDVPETEREGRVLIGSDLCRIRVKADEDSDDDIFAIRVNLDISISGCSEPFSWGVWVTQSKQNFFRYLETYEDDQSDEGSFGWLFVTMVAYRDHVLQGFNGFLACNVDWGPRGQRPKITLQESHHPLYFDQRDGISWERAVEIAQIQMRAIHSQ